MTHIEIRQILTELAQTEVGLDGDLPDGPLTAHLDSVQRLTLVVSIEDRFRICFEPEEEESAETIDEVVRIIHTKLNDKAPSPG